VINLLGKLTQTKEVLGFCYFSGKPLAFDSMGFLS
jgi:hypothetical protein